MGGTRLRVEGQRLNRWHASFLQRPPTAVEWLGAGARCQMAACFGGPAVQSVPRTHGGQVGGVRLGARGPSYGLAGGKAGGRGPKLSAWQAQGLDG